MNAKRQRGVAVHETWVGTAAAVVIVIVVLLSCFALLAWGLLPMQSRAPANERFADVIIMTEGDKNNVFQFFLLVLTEKKTGKTGKRESQELTLASYSSHRLTLAFPVFPVVFRLVPNRKKTEKTEKNV